MGPRIRRPIGSQSDFNNDYDREESRVTSRFRSGQNNGSGVLSYSLQRTTGIHRQFEPKVFRHFDHPLLITEGPRVRCALNVSYPIEFLPQPFTDSTNPDFGVLAQLHFVHLVNTPRKGRPTRTLTIREARSVRLLLCAG
jgi:hypothetical protein